MRSIRLALVLLSTGLVIAAGCASSGRGPAGASADPEKTRQVALERLKSHPSDADANRALGIALYQLSRPAEALGPMNAALQVRPRDRQALLFRARCLDALGRAQEALGAYGEFAAEAGSKERELARARMEQIRRAQIRAEVERSLAREDSLKTVALPESTVAVPEFANPSGADSLRPIAKGLAAMTMTDLAQVHSLRVLERLRLTTLVKELHLTHPGGGETVRPARAAALDSVGTVLGQQQRLARLTDPATGNPYYDGALDGISGAKFVKAVKAFQAAKGLTADGVLGTQSRAALDQAWKALPESVQAVQSVQPDVSPMVGAIFDRRTVPRVGRLLGARTIVQGSLLPIGEKQLQLQADLVPAVARSQQTVKTSEPVEGRFSELLTLQKRLTFEILDGLGIQPTREERKRIEQKETRDLDAFVAYCQGLDYEDRGMLQEALSKYRAAFARDPGFSMAGQAASALGTTSSDLRDLDRSGMTGVNAPPVTVVSDRAWSTADQLNIVPGLIEPHRFDIVAPENIVQPQGRIVIQGQVPGGGGSPK